MTLVELGNVIASFFGTTFDFHNFVTNMAAKVRDDAAAALHAPACDSLARRQLRLEDMIEEINEVHVTTWTEMITTSNPPIPNTQFSSYMDLSALKKHVVAFNAKKLKEVVGYSLRRPNITHETLKEIIEKLKAEGSWPVSAS